MAIDKLTSEQLNDHDFLIGLMESSDSYDTALCGQNEDGESVFVSVNPDNITVSTYQSNNWIRENVHWADGTEEESFSGRW